MPESAMHSVSEIWRYPVKSMRGESIERAFLGSEGLAGDRRFAFQDPETGYVASAKYPAKWKTLLEFAATTTEDGTVSVTGPDGTSYAPNDKLVEAISARTGRSVELTDARGNTDALERAIPEEVIAFGETKPVDFTMLDLAMENPHGAFADFAPIHIMTTSTLAALTKWAGHELTSPRYRPNLVIDTGRRASFLENKWIGRELQVGEVKLEIFLPTPRCAVPTLAQGDLPRDHAAVQVPLRRNRLMVEGFGELPCAGVYARVVEAGRVSQGDEVSLVPAK